MLPDIWPIKSALLADASGSAMPKLKPSLEEKDWNAMPVLESVKALDDCWATAAPAAHATAASELVKSDLTMMVMVRVMSVVSSWK